MLFEETNIENRKLQMQLGSMGQNKDKMSFARE